MTDKIINAGLCVFRENAWTFSCVLACLTPAKRKRMIALRDTVCAGFGKWHIHPVPSEGIVDAIRRKEQCDKVADNIRALQGIAENPAALPAKLW